ncbi:MULTISPECIES: spore protease YyaC [Allobacillus]|uniref:Spore protease YyaC n=1 Tax=Allobacillus salarius TaxID=1955272 RepID=A0A556PGA0_9BACI|nr:spore protease YyaC [Allobacillus salarius]TSJ63417.1 spore protease YyaC [Allobacillus salarius]
MSKSMILKKSTYHMNDSFVSLKLSRFLSNHLPTDQPIILLCIGTDRSTGDSLGPLVGTFLKESLIKNIHVFGTLDEPVHAKNLPETILQIEDTFQNPYIIAVDAALGSIRKVKTMDIGLGSLQPGAAMKKKISSIGDLYIKGYVNVGGFLEYTVLQCTRLSDVMSMAQIITKAIQYADSRLSVNCAD